jgi:hypothetical protein
MQKYFGSMMERNLEGRHEMNVFLTRISTPGKHSDAEFESGKRSIQSQKLRVLEFREIDNALNGTYNRILSQEK